MEDRERMGSGDGAGEGGWPGRVDSGDGRQIAEGWVEGGGHKQLDCGCGPSVAGRLHQGP